jgi:hypothetical protein
VHDSSLIGKFPEEVYKDDEYRPDRGNFPKIRQETTKTWGFSIKNQKLVSIFSSRGPGCTAGERIRSKSLMVQECTIDLLGWVMFGVGRSPEPCEPSFGSFEQVSADANVSIPDVVLAS